VRFNAASDDAGGGIDRYIAALTDQMGHKAASEWLAIDQASAEAIDAHIVRWRSAEPSFSAHTASDAGDTAEMDHPQRDHLVGRFTPSARPGRMRVATAVDAPGRMGNS
jgi:hypothetical protein